MQRTTLYVIGVCAVILLAVAGYFWFHASGLRDTTTTGPPAVDYYTCPMHPSVRSDRPGACPVCGMALVKKSQQDDSSGIDLAHLKTVSLSATQRVLANISTVPVKRADIAYDIDAVGSLTFAEPLQASVTARFGGRIEALHVSTTGARVARGDPLFDLYSPDLVSAEREYLLALESGSPDDTSSSVDPLPRQLLRAAGERLRVHFGLTDAQARELEASRKVHSTMTYYAPISGTVIQKQVQEGQYVDEGMPLYQLADLSTVWAILDVYEKDIRFVHAGQPVSFTSNAYPGKTFHGKVSFINPVLDSDTRTIRVRAEVPNPDGGLRPNMYIAATLRARVAGAVVVPTTAILSMGKRSIVWLEVRENMFEPRDVTTGVESGGTTQLLAGPAPGEMVVATGGFLIDSESALQEPSGEMAAHAVGSHAAGLPADTGASGGSAVGRGADAQLVRILVKGAYVPDEIHVKAGKPVIIQFYRDEDSFCTSEVVFPTLDIRRGLPAWKTTTIRLKPQPAGEIPFQCGMGMVDGRLVVE